MPVPFISCLKCGLLGYRPLLGSHSRQLAVKTPKVEFESSRIFVNEFNVHGSMHRNNILIYSQRDAALQSLCYLETALHVPGGTTTRYQKPKQLYLQHLVLVRPLLLPAAIAAGSSNGLTNNRCCRYSCLRS
jgi:hypothetical protein